MKKSLGMTSFIQAAVIFLYVSWVAILISNGDKLFGATPNPLGGILFLSLFIVSALICGFTFFWQPFLLWNKKKIDKAVKLVGYTTLWLLVFLLVAIGFAIS